MTKKDFPASPNWLERIDNATAPLSEAYAQLDMLTVYFENLGDEDRARMRMPGIERETLEQMIWSVKARVNAAREALSSAPVAAAEAA